MILSATALMALSACQTMASGSGDTVAMLAKKPPSCRSQPNVPVGDPPVVSYYCRAPEDADDPVQLDVYVGTTRNGPYFLPCSVPPLPQVVYDEFCTS